MQLSSDPLNKNIEKQLNEMLWGILSEIKSPEQMRLIFGDLLTESEKTALIKRLGTAIYLDKGRSYEDIKTNIKVSSATIAQVSKSLGGAGWVEIIRMIKAEEWAEAWGDKISKGIKKIFG
jgi:uncharacterized protein YerC